MPQLHHTRILLLCPLYVGRRYLRLLAEIEAIVVPRVTWSIVTPAQRATLDCLGYPMNPRQMSLPYNAKIIKNRGYHPSIDAALPANTRHIAPSRHCVVQGQLLTTAVCVIMSTPVPPSPKSGVIPLYIEFCQPVQILRTALTGSEGLVALRSPTRKLQYKQQ